MSDFLRTLAASGAPAYSGERGLTLSERIRRFFKSLPAWAVHSWRSSSCGFKFCTCLSLFLCLLLSLSLLRSAKEGLRYGYQQRRLIPCTERIKCNLAAVADLDRRSRYGTDKKPLYVSELLTGLFFVDPHGKMQVAWDAPPLNITGKVAEEGRGMELSELVMMGDSLLSFDDRTGIIYELKFGTTEGGSLRGSAESARSFFNRLSASANRNEILKSVSVLPHVRALLTEGDGEGVPKGMKIEWAAEKDGNLYIGSFGKEYTTTDGTEVIGTSNLWIAVASRDFTSIEHRDWTSQYSTLRKATHTEFPGYMIHEAVNWSPELKKWVFLPRRVSKEPYDETKDEQRGANIMLLTDEDFNHVESRTIKFPKNEPGRGFSSFKFIPETKDHHMIALRSEEQEASGRQRTYISVFDLHGDVIFPEMLISDDYKFEGIEIW